MTRSGIGTTTPDGSRPSFGYSVVTRRIASYLPPDVIVRHDVVTDCYRFAIRHPESEAGAYNSIPSRLSFKIANGLAEGLAVARLLRDYHQMSTCMREHGDI